MKMFALQEHDRYGFNMLRVFAGNCCIKDFIQLLSHIRPGSLIIHDGEKAHRSLIDKLSSLDEVYIANTKDKTYIENMKMINSACGWLKRYIYKFIGMKQKNLQSYLNWFVYLFRVKRDNEEYPETERVLRHLLLNSTHYTRK